MNEAKLRRAAHREQIADPALVEFPLPFCGTHYPLGFPLELYTNSRELVRAARETWGASQKHFDEKAVRLEIGVLPGKSLELPPEGGFRSRGNLITLVHDADNFMVVDCTG